MVDPIGNRPTRVEQLTILAAVHNYIFSAPELQP